MKIIKEGKPQAMLATFKCENCGCEFICDEGEYEKHEKTASTNCPTCISPVVGSIMQMSREEADKLLDKGGEDQCSE